MISILLTHRYIGLATDQSLVLLDEVGELSTILRKTINLAPFLLTLQLGRGTAPAEGVGICQAIAEELIRRKVRFPAC
jgi:DNA mismatch repair ATPase MutS